MRALIGVTEMTTMRTILRPLLCAAALVLLGAWPASAQRVLTDTTLSADVAAADDNINVTSSTGFTVGQLLFIDWEVMRITSLNGVAGTSTFISVQRGVDGTQRRAHDNTEQVLVTTNNTDFHQIDPDWAQNCQRGAGQAAIQPWVNTRTGSIWRCNPPAAGPATGTGGTWNGTNVAPLTYNSVQDGDV